MKPENREWLEANKGHWDLFKNDKVMRNGFDAGRALLIARQEFNPDAMFCTWCKEDLANLIKYVYTQYEKHLEVENMPKSSLDIKKELI